MEFIKDKSKSVFEQFQGRVVRWVPLDEVREVALLGLRLSSRFCTPLHVMTSSSIAEVR